MARKKKILKLKTAQDLIAALTAIVVAGLFLDGTSLANPVLSWIPVIVHTVIGWIAVILAVVSLIMFVVKLVK